MRGPSVVALPLSLLLASCAGAPGRLTNPRREPASFVTERQAFLVVTPAGLTRVQLDGSGAETLFPAGYNLLTMTPDASVVVLGDQNTNLFVRRAGSTEVRRVPELDRRVGSVALSPDGVRVAVARHADFSQPQALWSKSEDDAIWLVDTRSLAVEVLPKSRDELVTSLAWQRDGRGLILGMFSSRTVRLDLASRTRAPLETRPTELLVPQSGGPVCARTGARLELRGFRGDQGIDLREASGATRRLVVVEGRTRGFHDYRPTVRDPIFSDSCRYALFEFGAGLWVVEVETGVVGHVIVGGAARPLQAAPASAPAR
jgi:hypothetical protein